MGSSLSLRTKLIGAFGLISGMLIIIAMGGFLSATSVLRNITEVGIVRLPSIKGLAQIEKGLMAIDSNEHSLLEEKKPSEARESLQTSTDIEKKIEDGLKLYEPLPQTTDEARIWEEFRPLLKTVLEHHKMYLELARQKIQILEKESSQDQEQQKSLKDIEHEMTNSLAAIDKTFRESEAKIEKITELNHKIGEDATTLAVNEAHTAQTLPILAAIICPILSLTIGFSLSTSIARQLIHVSSRLREAAQSTTTTSAQLTSASQQLAQGASEQASSIEETSSTLEEISTTVQKNATHAKTARDTAEATQNEAQSGLGAVNAMVMSIQEIEANSCALTNHVTESSQHMAEIVRVIEDIACKTRIINEIVFQTKLLSFNASVEAARAGEHGKGFSVVADEVGNLAAMSGNAAKDIEQMLNESINRVNAIVNETTKHMELLTQKSTTSIQKGRQMAEECRKTLSEVVSGANESVITAGEVADASLEQAHGLTEIQTNVSRLDQVIQQNAALAEESAAAAQKLTDQAHILANSVQSLLFVVHGSATDDTLDQIHSTQRQRTRSQNPAV